MAKDPYTFIVTLDKQVNEVLDFTKDRQIFIISVIQLSWNTGQSSRPPLRG